MGNKTKNKTVRYLLLIKGDKGRTLYKLPTQERWDYLTLWNEWLKELKEKEVLTAGSPLEPGGFAFWENGDPGNVPDNYEMGSEVVTGFCVLTVSNEEEALMIAQNCPLVQGEFASCELRSFKKIS